MTNIHEILYICFILISLNEKSINSTYKKEEGYNLQKADKETLKRHNKRLLLYTLRRGDFSRTELAEATGLSNSTISVLISEMVESNIVFEKSLANSSGGRRQVIMSINPEAAYTLLLKIAPDQIEVAIVNLGLKLNSSKAFNLARNDQEHVTCTVLHALEWIKQGKSDLIDRIIGIGVSVAGLVDHSNDTVLYSAHLNLKNFDIKSVINSIFSRNVYVFKDTDTIAMGEDIVHKFNDCESYLYIWVGSGLGLSFVNKGEVLQLNRSGLELGHVRLESDGPRCTCGRVGCVEAFVSEAAAIREIEYRIKNSVKTLNYNVNGMKYLDIVKRSNDGDTVCREVLEYQAGYLGKAVALAINIFSPNTVIIGGPVSNIEWDFASRVQKSIRDNVLGIFSETKIQFSATTEEAAFIGMASKILDREFFIID